MPKVHGTTVAHPEPAGNYLRTGKENRKTGKRIEINFGKARLPPVDD